MSSPTALYRILFIDDEERPGLANVLQQLGAEGIVRRPEQVTDDDLASSDAVIVDHFLRLSATEAGQEPDVSMPVFRRPLNGFAVAAVLRSRLNEGGRGRHVAIAVTSGQLVDLGRDLPRAVREPLLAGQHDLDWAFSKQELPGQPQVVDRVLALARGAKDVGRGDFDPLLWLGLGDQSWANQAWREILETAPPFNGPRRNSDGRAALRWLAQRVLPFPTFVVDSTYAATRLRLTLEGFRAVMESEGSLASMLHACLYRGSLSAFTSPRWWLAGLDELLVEQGFDVYNLQHYRDSMESACGVPLEWLVLDDPVSIIDADYAVQKEPIERSQAVRLQPDGWPAWAQTAYGDAMDESVRPLYAAMDR